MACHQSDSGSVFICKSPLLGFTPEDQWIKDELEIFHREWGFTKTGKLAARKVPKEEVERRLANPNPYLEKGKTL